MTEPDDRIDPELAGLVVREALRFVGVVLLVGLSLLSLFLVPSLVVYTLSAMADPRGSPAGSALAVALIIGVLVWGWRAVARDRDRPPT